jgi:hypothetical protein
MNHARIPTVTATLAGTSKRIPNVTKIAMTIVQKTAFVTVMAKRRPWNRTVAMIRSVAPQKFLQSL